MPVLWSFFWSLKAAHIAFNSNRASAPSKERPLFLFPDGETKAQSSTVCSWSLGELGVEGSLEIRFSESQARVFSPNEQLL